MAVAARGVRVSSFSRKKVATRSMISLSECLRAEAGEGVEFIDAGDAAHHVFEAGLVGLVVGDEFDGGGAAGALLDALGQAFDGDFFGVADVDDFADGALGVD